VIAPQSGMTGSTSAALSLFNEQSGTINSGTPLPLAVNTPGQDVQLTFSGTAGQQASVVLANYTFSSCCYVSVSLINPNGTTLESAALWTDDLAMNPVSLPSTRDYSLVIAPQNGMVGSTSVALTLQ